MNDFSAYCLFLVLSNWLGLILSSTSCFRPLLLNRITTSLFIFLQYLYRHLYLLIFVSFEFMMSGTPKTLSSKVTSMKFMQRKQEQNKRKQLEVKKKKANKHSHLVLSCIHQKNHRTLIISVLLHWDMHLCGYRCICFNCGCLFLPFLFNLFRLNVIER